VPERKKGRLDPEQANTSASSRASAFIGPATVIEVGDEKPTITLTTTISETPVASVDFLLKIDLELTDAFRLRRTAKASKADDARVPEYVWDDRIMMSPKARDVGRDDVIAALQVIRRGVLRFWQRSVAVSFYEWWKMLDMLGDFHL
jgi:hypothetical protein